MRSIYVVSVSGGLSSAATLLRCCELYPNENIYPVFADTLWEDEDTYRFVDELESLVGIPIHRLRVGKTPAEVSSDQHMIFNSRIAKCTQVLKTIPIEKYATSFKSDDTRVYMCIGFNIGDRYDKVRTEKPFGRLPAPVMNWRNLGIYVKYPLWITPRTLDVRTYVESYGLTAPRLYDLKADGFNVTANCGGGCFKAGVKWWRGLLQTFPERYAEREAWETEMRQNPKFSNYAILTHKIDGVKLPYSLKEIREEYEAATDAQALKRLTMIDDIESDCTVECLVF